MRLLNVLGALVGISAIAWAAPAGLPLDARDEAKGECGVTIVYVTAPIHIGGAYSMTFTRTTHETAFVYTTVGKSTTTDVVEVTISSENAATITDSAFAPISSEIPVSNEPVTTLKAISTHSLLRAIFATTSKMHEELEVTPITVVEEPYSEISPVDVSGGTETKDAPISTRDRISTLTTYTNWRTETVRITTTLPNGETVVSLYTTNVASAIEQLQDGPDPTPTGVTSFQEPEQTFDPNDEVIVVEITRLVEPLITPLSEEPASVESSMSSADPDLIVFTDVRPEGTYASAIIGEIDGDKPKAEDEKIITLTNTLSITSTSTYINTEATETLISSADSFSSTIIPSANSSVLADTYSGTPYGWNNTYTTMTKIYASAPAYGYDHLSHDYAASNTKPLASVQPSEPSSHYESPITFTYSVPVYARTSIIQSETTAEPVLSSRAVPSQLTSIGHVKPGYGNGVWVGPVYGNGRPITDIASTLNSNTGATSIASSTNELISATTKTAASTHAQSTDKPSHSSPFSYIVSDISVSDSTIQTVRLPEATRSSSSESFTNATLTRDPDWRTRSTLTEAPSDLVAPSFLIPTITTVDPAKISSIADFLSSIESAGIETFTGSTATGPPSGIVAPSFFMPTVSIAPNNPTDRSSTASSTLSSASVSVTSCGEQGAFSLNFDDVPPLVGNVDQPLPLSSPYKHFFFSEGFAVGPPPRIPFIPESAPLILQFQAQSDVNVTRNDNFPAPGEYGATGEIGNGEYLRFGCYSFDAVAASVGCDSLGPDCEWQFTGVTYNAATGDYDEPYTQSATTPGCPAGENCALTDFVFLQDFKNIQSLRVNVTVEGVPKIWWMDDLQMRWSDDSCEAGNCRASHR